MHKPSLRLIAAIGRSHQIGAGNALLWDIPEDLQLFKDRTIGGVIIMGRKTWESIGKRTLPGRISIVVSRQSAPHGIPEIEASRKGGTIDIPGIETGIPERGIFWAPDLQTAIAAGHALNAARDRGAPFVIGGGEIYREALPLASDLLLTEVDTDPAADAFFPSFDPTEWREIQAFDLKVDPSRSPKARFRHLVRTAG